MAIARKLTELTRIMHDKVEVNLTDTILQVKTGQLLRSLKIYADVGSTPMSGQVYIDPVTDKALALEYGGKGFYTIVATNSKALHFWWEKEAIWFMGKSVNHPPSKKYGYIQSVYEEMVELVPEGFKEALDEVLSE